MSQLSSLKDPGAFACFTLSNGIKVFHKSASPNYGLPKVACSVLVMAGGRDDPAGKEGSAHFFEHMPFRGTKSYPSLLALSEPIENNGGYINAFTTDEATGYEIVVPSEMLRDAVSRLADMLVYPLMHEEDIEIERRVIIEELRNKLGSVNFFARQELYKGLLAHHPLVHSVIGTESALESITKQDLLHFHKTYYNAANVSLFFAGEYDVTTLQELCETAFGELASGLLTQRDITATQPTLSENVKILTPSQYNRSVYYLGRLLPATDMKEDLMIRIFSDMLNRGMTSPLQQEIREKRGLAYNLGISHAKYSDLGVLTFVVSTRFDQMDEVHTLFWQEVEKILTNQARFDEVKHMMKQSMLHREYTTGALVDTGVDVYLDYGRLVTLEEYISVLEEITLETTRNYMKQFLRTEDFLNIRVNCDTKQR